MADELVVGYDGTDGSKAALHSAVTLAKDLGAKVLLVFGYMPPGEYVAENKDHIEAVREVGEKVTAEAAAFARDAGVEVDVALVPEHSSEALVDTARERGARMIVVGSYGERPLTGAILGSTPHRLLHLSEVPVLVVRIPD
jgi:nucleotide-binding universal stress UspA family protein